MSQALKLITEMNESIQVLTEADAKTGKKNYFIEGIFLQTELKNGNGRRYPKEIVMKEVVEYQKKIDQNRAYGELNHPSGFSINMDRVSHVIKSLKEDGNNFIGRAKITTETPCGAIAKALLDEGCSLAVSSRGLGNVKRIDDMDVVTEFRLATAADIVADPSAPDAYVRGIMEGKEWVWENGILCERIIAQHKSIIQKAPSHLLEEKALKVWHEFLNGLSQPK